MNALLLQVGVAIGIVVSALGSLYCLARAITNHRWKQRIDVIRKAIVGLRGIKGDALEPIWPPARAAIARAVAETLAQSEENISVRPRRHPGGSEICGAIVILRKQASTENPRIVAQFKREVIAALPPWAYFEVAMAPDGVPLPVDRLTSEKIA